MIAAIFGWVSVRLTAIGDSGVSSDTVRATRWSRPGKNSDGQPITSTCSSPKPRSARHWAVISPRTPSLAERSSTALTKRVTGGLIASGSRVPEGASWAPTPTTTTGIVSCSMTSVRWSSQGMNSGRNALASGITNASNSLLIRAM